MANGHAIALVLDDGTVAQQVERSECSGVLEHVPFAIDAQHGRVHTIERTFLRVAAEQHIRHGAARGVQQFTRSGHTTLVDLFLEDRCTDQGEQCTRNAMAGAVRSDHPGLSVAFTEPGHVTAHDIARPMEHERLREQLLQTGRLGEHGTLDTLGIANAAEQIIVLTLHQRVLLSDPLLQGQALGDVPREEDDGRMALVAGHLGTAFHGHRTTVAALHGDVREDRSVLLPGISNARGTELQVLRRVQIEDRTLQQLRSRVAQECAGLSVGAEDPAVHEVQHEERIVAAFQHFQQAVAVACVTLVLTAQPVVRMGKPARDRQERHRNARIDRSGDQLHASWVAGGSSSSTPKIKEGSRNSPTRSGRDT